MIRNGALCQRYVCIEENDCTFQACALCTSCRQGFFGVNPICILNGNDCERGCY